MPENKYSVCDDEETVIDDYQRYSYSDIVLEMELHDLTVKYVIPANPSDPGDYSPHPRESHNPLYRSIKERPVPRFLLL